MIARNICSIRHRPAAFRYGFERVHFACSAGRASLAVVRVRLTAAALLGTMLVAASGLWGCDSCDRKDKQAPRRQSSRSAECQSAADCQDPSPCTESDCVDALCVTRYLAEGTPCDDDGNACNGSAACDAHGSCVESGPPSIDDGNACTLDRCDPETGVVHEPVPVDDFDACTVDACDPANGHITHQSVDIDDGDDCTFDSCDPKDGISHEKPKSFNTCEASCGEGFHVVSARPSAACGSAKALQRFCEPSCGDAFYACGTSCPRGYHSASRRPYARCGEDTAIQTFCQKNTGSSFYTCDPSCPEGYEKRSEAQKARCGPESAISLFCVGG